MGRNWSDDRIIMAQECHIKQIDLDFCNSLVVKNKRTCTITNPNVHNYDKLHSNVFGIYIITE